jgi:hypothetical protein
LSIRTAHVEEEDNAKAPQEVGVGIYRYIRRHYKGEMVVNNHRKQAVKMHIVYGINGEITSAEGKPLIANRERSFRDVNPTKEVIWVVAQQPGQEVKLAYTYSALVNR